MQKVKRLIQNCFLKKTKTKTNKTGEKRKEKKKGGGEKKATSRKRQKKKINNKRKMKKATSRKMPKKKKPKSPNVQNVCWGIFVQKRQGASCLFSLL